MNLKVGIVGLPNAGKSTLFNALLRKQVADMAPFPFCTIEPNVGIVPVPDARLDQLAKVVEETEGVAPPIVPAIVEFVDIAGLVEGASKGEGLGNKFLSHIREVDLICHVLRGFDDPSVMHVAGAVDPLRDRTIVETELILADLQTLNKQTEPRGVKDKEAQERWGMIEELKTGLDRGKTAREMFGDHPRNHLIEDLHLLTMKPVMYVFNVAESQLNDPKPIPAVDVGIWEHVLTVCAKTEAELSVMSPEDQVAYLSSLGLSASGLDRLIGTSYQLLKLLSFLTSGVKEVRAWTIRQGTTAPLAAGVIHTDFTKKFIKADVVDINDFVSLGGWHKAREAGKVRQEGKTYVIRDGDVVEFRIGS